MVLSLDSSWFLVFASGYYALFDADQQERHRVSHFCADLLRYVIAFLLLYLVFWPMNTNCEAKFKMVSHVFSQECVRLRPAAKQRTMVPIGNSAKFHSLNVASFLYHYFTPQPFFYLQVGNTTYSMISIQYSTAVQNEFRRIVKRRCLFSAPNTKSKDVKPDAWAVTKSIWNLWLGI